jgi:hypothetical protein
MVLVRHSSGWKMLGPIDLHADETASVDFHLPPPGRVRGRVLEAGNRASPAIVRLFLATDDPQGSWPVSATQPLCETVTNEQGEFTFDQVPEGNLLLSILAPLHLEKTIPIAVKVRETCDVGEFRLAPAASLEVIVEGLAAGKKLNLELVGGSTSQTGVQESTGHFFFRHVEPGTWELQVYSLSYENSLFPSRPMRRRTVDLKPGSQVEAIDL